METNEEFGRGEKAQTEANLTNKGTGREDRRGETRK
jgi:hypothetical protein